LDVNDFQGTAFCDEYTLTGPATLGGGFTGQFGVPQGIGTGTGGTTATIGLNNSNTGGVTGSTATGQLAVTTGLEVSIPLSSLGNSTGPFLVLADINGGGDGFLSNQFLPGLPAGTGNVGGGGPFSGASQGAFNFSNTPGEFFTVSAVPEPTSIGALIAAAGIFSMRRRGKTPTV
jgi:hypothetical protein